MKNVNDIINENLIDADIYRLLASCFDFPDEKRLAKIIEISKALSEIEHSDSEVHGLICSLNQAINKSEILHDYSLIFIKGGVPLNESQTLQRFESVSDVSAFYNAFGFSPRSGENPDSIMYQLEFMALLLLKQTIAPNNEAREVSEKAYKDFLTEHVSEFSIAMSKKVSNGNAGNYFQTVARLLETFIKYELKKINIADGK